MRAKIRGSAGFCVLLLACACSLAAQTKNPADLGAGKLLVAERNLPDPVFAKSVILLVRYDAKGALGLMLNRQTTVPISRILKEDSGAKTDSDPIFIGGPVSIGTVFALARARKQPGGARPVLGDIFFLETKTALDAAFERDANESTLRVYAGYCGWDPGQLDSEVLNGSWYIFGRSEDLAFDAKPKTLWSRLIRKADAALLLRVAALAQPTIHRTEK